MSHDPSEIIPIYTLFLMLKTVVLVNFCGNQDYLVFEINIFCSIINVFTVTFDQFAEYKLFIKKSILLTPIF